MSYAQAACHPDCLALIEDTDARNTMLLQANHGGGAGSGRWAHVGQDILAEHGDFLHDFSGV